MGLKLSEDGKSWLPNDANSVNEYVADLETSESLDPGVKLEPKLGSQDWLSGLVCNFRTHIWTRNVVNAINDNIILFFSTLLIIQ